MAKDFEIIHMAVGLIIKSVILAAQFAGRTRMRNLKHITSMDMDEKDKEIVFLRDKVYQQQLQISILQKGLKKNGTNNRYTLREKLYILHYVETFQIARHRVTEHPGIAKSTLYRWLHSIEEKCLAVTPANTPPAEIAAMVWEIATANVHWERVRISAVLRLLDKYTMTWRNSSETWGRPILRQFYPSLTLNGCYG